MDPIFDQSFHRKIRSVSQIYLVPVKMILYTKEKKIRKLEKELLEKLHKKYVIN